MRYAIKAVEGCGKGCPHFSEGHAHYAYGRCSDSPQIDTNGNSRVITVFDGDFPRWCELEEVVLDEPELDASIRNEIINTA